MVSAQHRLPDRPGDPHQDPGRGRRLGIDVGSVRIGVACSDPDAILATPVETVRRDRNGKHLRRLVALAAELEAVEVVIGLPRTLADRTGPSAIEAGCIFSRGTVSEPSVGWAATTTSTGAPVTICCFGADDAVWPTERSPEGVTVTRAAAATEAAASDVPRPAP